MTADPGAAGKGGTLDDLQDRLGHRFGRRDLLELSLVHRSWAHERGTPLAHNESLEFLGDAVLALGVSLRLMERFGTEEVGSLARARAWLVSEENLARKAKGLGLGHHLKLGRGEEKGGGREKGSLLADAYEAVLAAVYLDGGMEKAQAIIDRDFSGQIARMKPGGRSVQDWKTDLQEALQAVGLPVPAYAVSGEEGPAHRKTFRVDLSVAGTPVASGRGGTKKAAEQQAARLALRRIAIWMPALRGTQAEDRSPSPAAPPAPPAPDRPRG